MGKVTTTKASNASKASPKKTKGVKTASPTKEAKKAAKTLPPVRASIRLQASKVIESSSGGDDDDEEFSKDQDFSTDGDSKYETEEDASSVRSLQGSRKIGEVAAVKSNNRTPLQSALSKHLDGK
jgi:hypothetical protein